MAGAELDSLLGDLEQRVSLAEAEETVTSSFQETRSFITCTTTTTQQLQQPRSHRHNTNSRGQHNTKHCTGSLPWSLVC